MGDLNEKGEQLDYEIKKLDDDTWEINGLAPFDEVVEAMELRFPEEEENDYETFGGYVCKMLGEVPDDGATAEAENDYVKVEVLRVAEHRIEKMRVTKKPKPQTESEEENGKKAKKTKRSEEEEEKSEKTEKTEKSEKPEKSDKAEKAEKADDDGEIRS